MIRPGSSVKRKEQTKATAPQAKHKVIILLINRKKSSQKYQNSFKIEITLAPSQFLNAIENTPTKMMSEL